MRFDIADLDVGYGPVSRCPLVLRGGHEGSRFAGDNWPHQAVMGRETQQRWVVGDPMKPRRGRRDAAIMKGDLFSLREGGGVSRSSSCSHTLSTAASCCPITGRLRLSLYSNRGSQSACNCPQLQPVLAPWLDDTQASPYSVQPVPGLLRVGSDDVQFIGSTLEVFFGG